MTVKLELISDQDRRSRFPLYSLTIWVGHAISGLATSPSTDGRYRPGALGMETHRTRITAPPEYREIHISVIAVEAMFMMLRMVALRERRLKRLVRMIGGMVLSDSGYDAETQPKAWRQRLPQNIP
jgi:hypothetical protein